MKVSQEMRAMIDSHSHLLLNFSTKLHM